MLKAFESLVRLLEAAANEVVHDTRHFIGCTFSLISEISRDKTAFL